MFKPKGVIFCALVFTLLFLSCSGPDSDLPLLTAEIPLHLEEHIDDSRIEGSEVSEDSFSPVKWDFSEPQPQWMATTPRPFPAGIRPATVSQTDDALHISLGPSNANPNGMLVGGAFVNIPEWDHRDWAHVLIEARSSGPGNINLGFNVWEREGHPMEGWPYPYEMSARGTPLVGNGILQTYQLQLEPRDSWEEPVRQLGLWIQQTRDPLEVEILSITVVPLDALYVDAPVGVSVDKRNEEHRRTLYTHAPGRIKYRVQVPPAGRLDFGLSVLREEVPVTFRISAAQAQEREKTLFEETYANPGEWGQRYVDLTGMAGKIVTIALEADSERPGAVALWAVPTLTGARTKEKPDIVTLPAAAKNFTIVVLPDTQNYSQFDPAIFTDQTQWIVDNKDALNIVYVAHEGDIVNAAGSTEQWNNAVAAMSLLENPLTTDLPDGIPYGLVPGNHEYPTTNYNSYFGISRFLNRDYYGDGYPSGRSDSNYTLFSASGMDFIVINLEYEAPSSDLLDWADSLMKIYSDRRAVIVTHCILENDGRFDPRGQQIYDALKDNPNLFLMLCGHRYGEAMRIEEYNGNTVHILLANYQDLPNGGNGWLRIMEFSPENDTINVTTYSPSLNQYGADRAMGENTTSDVFSIKYDMNVTADSRKGP